MGKKRMDEIVEITCRLLCEKGYETTSISDLVDQLSTFFLKGFLAPGSCEQLCAAFLHRS